MPVCRIPIRPLRKRRSDSDDEDGSVENACSVVSGHGCKAPPAMAGLNTKAECHACGEPVCTFKGCSTRVLWYGGKRKRVCENCKEDKRRLG